MSPSPRASLTAGRALTALVALILVAGLVVVFSGTLSRSTDVETQAEQQRARVAELEERLATGRQELEFVRSDDFVRWQARVYGMGEKDERPFALEPGAPSPRPITPIGPQDGVPRALSPFEAWMELLFGA